MKLTAASKVLGIRPDTLRKWIRQGCPCLALGEIGRGHSSEVDPEAAKSWRAQRAVPSLDTTRHDDTLHRIAVALYDCIKRDHLAACARITEQQAYLIAVKIYERIYCNLHQKQLTRDKLPSELKMFIANYLESVERGDFSTQRR